MKTYVGTNKNGVKVCTAVIDLEIDKDGDKDCCEPFYILMRQAKKVPEIQNADICYELGKVLCNALPTTKFIGKSKCAPEDEFDETKGIELAKTRARAKYYAALIKAWKKLCEYTQDMADNVEKTKFVFSEKASKNEDYMEELLKQM